MTVPNDPTLNADQINRHNAVHFAHESARNSFADKDLDSPGMTEMLVSRARRIYEFLSEEPDAGIKGNPNSIKSPEYKKCVKGNEWGDCVLEDGHEDYQHPEVGRTPELMHIDRHGTRWNVGTMQGSDIKAGCSQPELH